MAELVQIASKLDLKVVAVVVLALSIFIDLSPKVKFNPWKAIFGRIGRYINNSIETEISGFKKDVYEKIDKLSKDQTEQFDLIRKEQETQANTLQSLVRELNYKEMSRLRWDITDFDTNISRGNKYPREQYRYIIDEANKYIRMAEDQELDLRISPENVIRVKEAMESIEKHYNEQTTNNPGAFMI